MLGWLLFQRKTFREPTHESFKSRRYGRIKSLPVCTFAAGVTRRRLRKLVYAAVRAPATFREGIEFRQLVFQFKCGKAPPIPDLRQILFWMSVYPVSFYSHAELWTAPHAAFPCSPGAAFPPISPSRRASTPLAREVASRCLLRISLNSPPWMRPP